MSLSEKMNSGVTAPQAPTTGAPAEATGKKAEAFKNQKAEAFKNQGAALRASMTDDQKAAEGSKSDTVEFIACLANPAKKQSRKTEGEYVPSHQVVGYVFKVLEDTEVPVAPLKEDCTSIIDVQQPASTRIAKAGEEVYMNIVEAAMFISRGEYAGKFTGNGKTVFLSVVFSKAKPEPTPCFKRPTEEGSIKTSMIMVAENVGGGADGTGGHWETVANCDQFKALYRRRTTTRGLGNKKEADSTTKAIAAAFRQMYGM